MVEAGIGVIVAASGLPLAGSSGSKHDDINKIATFCSAVGSIAAFAPPPAGPVIGTTLGVVGAILPMFAGPAPPSEELKAIQALDKKLDTVVANQDKMMSKLDDIGDQIKVVNTFKRDKIDRITRISQQINYEYHIMAGM